MDADAWILYEPRYGAPGDGAKSYIPQLTDPRQGPPRLFQAPHLYVLSVESTFVYGDTARERVKKWGVERSAERDRNVAGVWLGEFGSFPSVDGFTSYLQDVIHVSEELRTGFAAWAWDPWEFGMLGDRDPETLRHAEGPALDVIVRPYPQAFGGVPEAFSFDPETRVLTATWTITPDINPVTDIYLAADRWYPEGYIFEYDSTGYESSSAHVSTVDNHLTFSFDDPQPPGATITLRPTE